MCIKTTIQKKCKKYKINFKKFNIDKKYLSIITKLTISITYDSKAILYSVFSSFINCKTILTASFILSKLDTTYNWRKYYWCPQNAI